MASSRKPKVKIGISLDADLYEWLRLHTGTGNEFASISHAIERSVARYQAEALRREQGQAKGPPEHHRSPPR